MKSVAVLLALAVAALGLLVYQQRKDLDQKNADIARLADQIEKATAKHWIPTTQAITRGDFQVPNTGAKYFRFEVDTTTMRAVSLSGRFTATGGLNNAVDVLVLDDDNFTNWENNNPAKAIFESVQKTVGDVSATFERSGTYYLVFKTHGIVGRSVNADVALHFERLKIGS